MPSIAEARAQARARLAEAAIAEAPLEADLLVAHALGLDPSTGSRPGELPSETGQGRLALYRDPDQPLTQAQANALEALLGRRCAREPLPYLLGQREFYGLEFAVDRRVLIPRPETETLVELALNWLRARRGDPLLVADIGTGSGCIAIALAVHLPPGPPNLPQVHLIATDLSPQALAVARANAERHGVLARIDLRCGDLLEPLEEPVDLIIANLPYVRLDAAASLPPEVRQHEPPEALFAGPDGLKLLRRCLLTAPSALRPSGALLLEFDPRQRRSLLRLARRSFPQAQLSLHRDLAGRSRALFVQT